MVIFMPILFLISGVNLLVNRNYVYNMNFVARVISFIIIILYNTELNLKVNPPLFNYSTQKEQILIYYIYAFLFLGICYLVADVNFKILNRGKTVREYVWFNPNLAGVIKVILRILKQNDYKYKIVNKDSLIEITTDQITILLKKKFNFSIAFKYLYPKKNIDNDQINTLIDEINQEILNFKDKNYSAGIFFIIISLVLFIAFRILLTIYT
ncbi:hypothetical protein BX659_1605 [Orenia metallireducens]|uniref:Uncharacterized protein n=1 Tax=Orenia metallireducens TaxID=1413210 RepID=A0A285ILL0_9FIRM|nr:hypothetical protein [Orenia metallireducens]PRX16924.1 hypothetical protein BX659_1605 [Orenia metallireducens]SNY47861.1 hypothetical protein SAMN06265827_1605 [Orenia metallireducens]